MTIIEILPILYDVDNKQFLIKKIFRKSFSIPKQYYKLPKV